MVTILILTVYCAMHIIVYAAIFFKLFLGGFAVPKVVENGGFIVPESNAFGNTFRDYSADTARKEIVKALYRQSHINQTYDFVRCFNICNLFRNRSARRENRF